MSGMRDLGNVLELVVDGLNDGAFARQQLIQQGHETVGHILAQGCDELKSLLEELLE